LARFEQRRKRQRAEHHEERASSLRLAVADHEFECANFSIVPKRRARSSTLSMLYKVSRKEPLRAVKAVCCAY